MIFLIIPVMVLIPLMVFNMLVHHWTYTTYVKPKFAPKRVRFYVIDEDLLEEWVEWRLGPKCADPRWWDRRDELIRELEI